VQNLIEKIRDVEALALEEQKTVGRGPGGQELSLALTQLRTARLFLQDAVQGTPAATPFSEPKK
jgi:hypothetical protein